LSEFKYAFLCFKNFDDAEYVVNIVPNLSLSDEKHNEEIKKIAYILKDKEIPKR